MGGLQTAITLVAAASSFALMLLPRRKWNQPQQLLHWPHANLATPIHISWDWLPIEDQLVNIKTPDLNSLLCLFSVPQLLVASLSSLWEWKSSNSGHFFAKNSTDSTSCLQQFTACHMGTNILGGFLGHWTEVNAEVDDDLGQLCNRRCWAPPHSRKRSPESHPTDLVPGIWGWDGTWWQMGSVWDALGRARGTPLPLRVCTAFLPCKGLALQICPPKEGQKWHQVLDLVLTAPGSAKGGVGRS